MVLWLLGSTLLLCWIISGVVRYIRCVRSTRGHPGYRVLFSPPNAAQVVPPIPGISLGKTIAFHDNYNGEKFGYDAYLTVAAFPIRKSWHISDPQAIKVILGSRFRFVKPVKIYQRTVNWFGANVLSADELHWSRHRKIAAPAFTEKNVALVCQRSVDMVEALIGQNSGLLKFDNVATLTFQIALSVIASAGFGFNADRTFLPAGHRMSFYDALEAVSHNIFIRVVLPPFLWGNSEDRNALRASGLAGRGLLGSNIRKTSIAFSEVKTYIAEMINERRTSRPDLLENNADLLSNILNASEDDGSFKAIADDEVTGNIFIFLIAGHETTAHTLAFTFGLLALHPEFQEELYHHLQDILGGRPPRYADLSALNLVMATVNETLRMYPPVPEIPKLAVEDVSLDIKTAYIPGVPDSTVGITIEAGSEVLVNVAALHYHPRYWERPDEFRPHRFLDPKWPRDAFLPFSSGPRSCMGRRFTETESVTVLAVLVSRYTISVDPENFTHVPGESLIQTRKRLLKAHKGLSLTPERIPLVFTPRATMRT